MAETVQVAQKQGKARRRRKRTSWLGRIDSGDSRPMRSCVVVEITDRDARLAAASFAGVPDDFFLLLSASGNVGRACRVQQRTDTELVVRFVPGRTGLRTRNTAGPASSGEVVFVD